MNKDEIRRLRQFNRCQQAIKLCKNELFQSFTQCADEKEAEDWICSYFGIASPYELCSGFAYKWNTLVSDYDEWCKDHEQNNG
jgi:hypothetical protein